MIRIKDQTLAKIMNMLKMIEFTGNQTLYLLSKRHLANRYNNYWQDIFKDDQKINLYGYS